MKQANLELSQLPKQFWDVKLDALDSARDMPYADPAKFFIWLTEPIPLLTIIGPPMSGKTTLAAAVTRYWIEDAVAASPDTFSEFRIFWTSAPLIMPAYQHSLMYQDAASYDAILQKTRLLVLDDLDAIEEKHIPAAMSLIRSRIDAKRLTIITVCHIDALEKLGTGLTMRVRQGKKVSLYAKP